MSIVQKFKDLLGKHSGKADQAIDKAGDMIDRKTGGKYQQQVDQAQQYAKDAVSEQREPRSR